MATTKVRKRVNLREGDLFQISFPDGRQGFGIIARRGPLKNGGTPYVAIFKSAYSDSTDLDAIVRDEVALTGWTMDALVYHGDWVVVARNLPVPSLPYPNFKVRSGGKTYVTDVDGEPIAEATEAEIELLENQFSLAPIVLQDAFEALHGFGRWNQSYDCLRPAYAETRITRRFPLS